jgi:putative ABC transport system permease protein
MIRNYILIARRNMIRHKTHTAINVIGLALGITCCMFILLWVQDERGMDNFHQNEKNLYVLYQTTHAGDNTYGDYNMPLNYDKVKGRIPLLEDVKLAVPGVVNIACYATGYDLPWGHPETLQVGEKKVKINGSRVGADFFKMLSYPIIAGNNAETAIKDQTNIAISRHTAEVFFGSPQNAIGETIRFENTANFIVSSVFEDVPSASSLKFDFVINWDWQRLHDWSSNYYETYIQVANNADPARIAAAINSYLRPRMNLPSGTQFHVGLQPYGEKYLHNIFVNGKPSAGRIEYVRIFSEVAIFILIIACINFMNLATAKSVKRAKEIGVRKVVGSGRGSLIGQFFGESLVYSFTAMLFSIILVLILLVPFNSFTGKQIGFPLTQLSFWISLISLAVITGIIAGSYPALYLSSLKPVSILKGTLRFTRGSIWFRKGLTIFQFVLSIVLLICTIVITRQTSYVQNAHLGYDKENMIYTRIEGELSKKNKYFLFKQEASKMPGIVMIDRTTEVPQAMNFVVTDDEITWQGKQKNSTVGVKPASVGFDFLNIMKLQVAEGRGFSPTNPTDSTDAFMINEEAAKEMGMKSPIGQWVQAWNKRGHIIGVLKDFHTQSFREPIRPILLDIKEGEYFGVIIARTQPGKTQEALASLAKVYHDINPNYPFSYQFVDQEYKKLYTGEMIISTLSIVFALVAIAISCLGLLALVMFSAEQRVKEFGVRKVLGASLGRLVTLFAGDFLKLVLIAFLIAAPLGWLLMSAWLRDFAYKIDISWWIFALAGIGSVAIALFTLSYEAFKAAVANPVKSLRSE